MSNSIHQFPVIPGMSQPGNVNDLVQPQAQPAVNVRLSLQSQTPSAENVRVSPQSQVSPAGNVRVSPQSQIPSAENVRVSPQSQIPSAENVRVSPQSQASPAGNTGTGFLTVRVLSAIGYLPVASASVRIAFTGSPEGAFQSLTTDSSGVTEAFSVPTPDISLSLAPDRPQPYSELNVSVSAPDYEPLQVSGVQILPECQAVLEIRMRPLYMPEASGGAEILVIPAHTLYGDYPAKLPEDEIKPLPDTGEIVLSRVVIPEYIIVHDGDPADSTAKNYYVRYKDYIKNVASNEIYSTWPEAAIYANILAIMSFTLNRVYTEWYRSKGYPFTITSSTAYDQKWVYGRNTFENIDLLVDRIFANYLSRPGVRQPIFTSYCDGRNTTCRGMSQWGSRYLADEGYTAIQILRYYYGNDLYINTADQISGVPSSYPGYELTTGSDGEKVRQLQSQLNRIAQNFPAIPVLSVDGIYGPKTAASVRAFQEIFGLPVTGVTDYTTWYKISEIYTGITRISEPGAY